MADIDDSISLIEDKINRVLRVAGNILSDNEDLRCQVEELKGQLDGKNDEIKVLESKYQNLKLTRTMTSSPDDIKNVKHQVDNMVREIDKCIALLNR